MIWWYYYSDNVDGEWSAFSDIIRRKDSSIQTQVASLQMKVISEDKVVESRTGELLTEWEKEKPIEVGRLYCCVESRTIFLEPYFWIYSFGFCGTFFSTNGLKVLNKSLLVFSFHCLLPCLKHIASSPLWSLIKACLFFRWLSSLYPLNMTRFMCFYSYFLYCI